MQSLSTNSEAASLITSKTVMLLLYVCVYIYSRGQNYWLPW